MNINASNHSRQSMIIWGFLGHGSWFMVWLNCKELSNYKLYELTNTYMILQPFRSLPMI